ncbi:MAG TPA: hypothetical protein VHT91_45085 [Kofleriaceae bacterium]|nr:hypothetical protein [Kofleriaceae bacterium]
MFEGSAPISIHEIPGESPWSRPFGVVLSGSGDELVSSSLSRSALRDILGGDVPVEDHAFTVMQGDAHDPGDLAVRCGQSCPRTNSELVRAALAAETRALGNRKKSRRWKIPDLALDALKGRVDPRGRPNTRESLSTLLPRARAEEQNPEQPGRPVAMARVGFYPRGKSDLEDIPHVEQLLNDVMDAVKKTDDPEVVVLGMASQTSGTASLNTDLAELRAITVARKLDRLATTKASELQGKLKVYGVGIYALQEAGFALDGDQVEKYFGSGLLPRSPHGVQDTRDAISNQAVIVVVVSRSSAFVVLLDLVDIDRNART